MEQNTLEMSDFIAILKRRKWNFILTAAGVFIVAAIIAFIWPPTYRSISTILIEDQEIPREYVVSTVTGYAEQRLQSINQRIMSHTRLLEIINRFNLYKDLQEKRTTEELVEKMRKNIKFRTVSADVIDPRSGRPAAATIAFTLSFDGENPAVVQQVANVLASLYLEENLKNREQLTAGASRFIEEEAKTVQARLNQLDAKIAVFKQRNLDSLPELSQLNLQSVDRTDRDIDQLKDQLRTLKEKEGYLQTQLASTYPDISNPDNERLKELRAKIVNLRTRYSETYPDVIKTKQEIAELERRVGKANREGSVGGRPDNPAYVALASQFASTQSDIESIRRQLKDAAKKRDGYRRRMEAGPRVEEQYKLLQVERNNAQLKYDDLMKKFMEARVAQGLERGQMGERFTLIDAARLPEKPVFPNIPIFLLLGIFLGVGAGVGNAALREHADQSAHTAEDLTTATNLPVLASIPTIVTREETSEVKKKRITLLIGAGVVVVVGLLIFHFFIMDLDVLWARVMRRLAL